MPELHWPRLMQSNVRMLGVMSIRCPVCEGSECALRYNDRAKRCGCLTPRAGPFGLFGLFGLT
jgi:hypothetical protein